MAGFSLNNPLLLVLGIGGLWFFARFILGPRRGAPGLKSMFAREKPIVQPGIGKDAIRTLIDDTRAFVVEGGDLLGLLLAGPFAAKAATTTSSVILIVLCRDLKAYSDAEWLPRWAYPARGHAINTHVIEVLPEEVIHRFTLRGSPEVVIHFVPLDRLEAPTSLQPALGMGAILIEDPSGAAEKLRQHWLEALRRTESTKN
jgi:hypothetical protein